MKRARTIGVPALVILCVVCFTLIVLSGQLKVTADALPGDDLVSVESSSSDSGGLVRVSALDNVHAASIAELSGMPEVAPRVSLEPPGVFDESAYLADKSGYLDIVEPGRVYQTEPVGEAVPPLKSMGRLHHRLMSGESVELAVLGVAGMPVTFTSFDLGHFKNGLSTITVEADADGIARAMFSAGSGTRGHVSVTAGSPVCSGMVSFSVFVAKEGQ